LFNLFFCNQGIKTVAKETEDEVKHHGVKALKDDGVEGSFVNQGINNVAKETEDKVKHHGVKASKDDGVEGSLVSFRQAVIITQSIVSY
jgi:uncharacterized protein (DUF2164 family)